MTRGVPKLMKAVDVARILSNCVGPQPQVYLSVYDPVKGEFYGGPYESVQVLVQNPVKGTGELVVLVQSRTKTDVWLEILQDMAALAYGIPGVFEWLVKASGPVAKFISDTIIDRYFWGPGRK